MPFDDSFLVDARPVSQPAQHPAAPEQPAEKGSEARGRDVPGRPAQLRPSSCIRREAYSWNFSGHELACNRWSITALFDLKHA